MKRFKLMWIALASLAVGVVGVLWFGGNQDREPTYRARSLSQWITMYIHSARPVGTTDKATEAEEAVRRIGTNAVPTLVRWISQKDSKLRQFSFRIAQKLELVHVELRRAAHYRTLAFYGFRLLGADGQSAIPELTRLLQDNGPAVDANGTEPVAESAAYALGEIGAPAVSALSQALTNGNVTVRRIAAAKLGDFGSYAGDAVRPLVQALRDKDLLVRLQATRSLGHIHRSPKLAVPALVRGLSDPTEPVRLASASALARYGQAAKVAVPRLVALQTNNWEGPEVERAINKALKSIDSDQEPAANNTGPANGSKPIRSETNQTSSAAGFRR